MDFRPLSWFQFSFLVDVIIFISNFSGLVSCLLLIFYIKRIRNLDRTWSVQRLNQLFLVAPTGWDEPSHPYVWWWKCSFWNVEFEKSKTVNHVQNNILVCCNKSLLLHDYHCSDLSFFREMCQWIERMKYCYQIASSVWENYFCTVRSK